MKTSYPPLILGLSVLLGCATPEQRAQQAAEQQQRRDAQAQQVVNAIKARCSAFGFREGTDAYANCIHTEVRAFEAQMHAQRQQRDAANDQSIRQGLCLAGNRQYCDYVPGTQYQQGTHTYIINGRHVVCTTSGAFTHCF